MDYWNSEIMIKMRYVTHSPFDFICAYLMGTVNQWGRSMQRNRGKQQNGKD